MASVNIFDPITGRTKSVTVEMQGTVVIQDLDANTDYYVLVSTGAKTVGGGTIVPVIIRNIWDPSPVTLTEKIEAAIKSMVNYGGGSNAMDFSS